MRNLRKSPLNLRGFGWMIGLCAIGLIVFSTQFPSSSPPPKLSKFERIDLAIEQELEMTADPSLGYAPRERLIAAREYMVRKQQAHTRTAISGINWNERGPNNVGGRTRAILVDLNDNTYETLWAGSVAGGLWTCSNISDANPTWNSIDPFFENMAITTIAQNPNQPDTMYFGTGEGFFNSDAVRGLGIWRTLDGGATWAQLPSTNGFPFNYVQKIVVADNGDVFAATRDDGIMRSSDHGGSWTQVLGMVTSPASATDRAADIEIAANGDIYVTMGLFDLDGIYKSTNGGASFSKLTSGLPTSSYARIELAVAPSDANRVYALFHDTSTNGCLGIYSTSNAGGLWTAVSNPNVSGGSNFAGGQAWYDLTAAVDPNDPDRLFIGGIDLMVSGNGGTSFTQISDWTGGSFPYVHADHHAIVFEPGNSNVIYFGNDGGIARSANGTSSTPSFTEKNEGYNVTQFYAADFTANPVDSLLGGTQDNGTHLFTNSGINATTRVTGGDGGFCHIDQNDSRVQISAYIYNYYWVSRNGWTSNTQYFYSNSGRFINPTDYDDDQGILYGAYSAGSYSRITNIKSGTLTGANIALTNLGSAQISAVTVSPNTANRVFMGGFGGILIRVDDAHTNTPTETVIDAGALPTGYISCIAVEEGDDNHLLVTISNYGYDHVWETTDGGTSWTSVNGNLPDMPVRWAIFNPKNNDHALIATELGVWSTTNLNGGSTDWDPTNDGLANVRVDMLKYRASDSTFLAATHGRGLFTAQLNSRALAEFANASQTISESSASGTSGDCLGYVDVSIEVAITQTPSANFDVDITVNGNSTADSDDYDFPSGTSLTFNSAASQYLTLRIFDDGIAEGIDTLVLDLSTVMVGSDSIGERDSIVVLIKDDQMTAFYGSQFNLFYDDFEGGAISSDWTMLQNSSGSDMYQAGSAAALSSAGFTIPNNGSVIAATNDDNCACDKSADWIFTKPMDLTEVDSAYIYFDAYFEASGSEVAYLIISGDNGASWNAFSLPGNVNWVNYFLNLSSFVGLSQVRVGFYYGDGGGTSKGLAFDNVTVTGYYSEDIESTLSASDEHELGPNETIHFYSSTGDLIAEIENNSAHDFGCTEIQIDRAGSSTSEFWYAGDPASELMDKTLMITPTTNNATASITYTLYYTAAEVAGWEAATGKSWTSNAKIVKNPGSITNVTPGTPYPDGNNIEQGVSGIGSYGSGYFIRATFNSGFSGVGTGDPGSAPLPVELLELEASTVGEQVLINWATASEQNSQFFEVERLNPQGKFTAIGQVDAAGNSHNTQTYSFWDTQPSTGQNLYRLRSVDVDGSFEHSHIVEAWISLHSTQMNVYPNPFVDRISLEIPESLQGAGTLRILNLAGQQLFESDYKLGINELNLSNLDLAQGTYLLQVTDESGNFVVEKLTKR
ncbi:T9SS type A sorting domain-containing protein [Pontibacter sp. G13]|uniref:T9SS type A sorting domain-containing protein n=1 Tax=Pontibacter sp. G13 TaxID=3074898 RepID=UPI00288C4CD3|nr:T9SS type A sorting domain-containing protein [Pontibacter sp. G13]WNJ16175.1 T9SS type A sorting domain-containing protein [Pontibacter sp. G13]